MSSKNANVYVNCESKFIELINFARSDSIMGNFGIINQSRSIFNKSIIC